MDEEELEEDLEIVEELEGEVDELEHEFESVKSEDVPETTREKQKQVQQILEEVHEQISFLKDISQAEND